MKSTTNENPMPERIARLPRDDASRPVPWFVQWIDGKPDFRVMDGDKLILATKERLCWVCGQRLGKYVAFVLGPMCAVNRINAEPPSHLTCAQFSVRTCPFLSTPRMHRRERDLPEDTAAPAGIAIKRNPGAAAVWVTVSYRPFNPGNGILFRVGPPVDLFWYCEGREATRAEVMASIESGLPLLQKLADEEGPEARASLEKDYQQALKLLPL
jgi:hypothetical protein